MIWGIAAIISFQLVDTYYVSLLGTQYLAAMSYTFPITLFVFSIIMGFGIAMSSVLSRLIGEGKSEDVRRVTTHGLGLVCLTSLTLAFVGYTLRDHIFEWMGADADMRVLIHEYMTIWFFGVPFLALPFSGNSAIRAAGSATIPATIMVLSAVLNAALAPFFIFGWAGLPAMTLKGAAIATVFCQFLSAISVLYVLKFRLHMLLPSSDLRLPQFGDSCKRLAFIAVAAGLTSAIVPLVNSFVVSVLSPFGKEAVAAFGISSRVEAFCFIILMAMAVGMGPVIGQNYGAGKFSRVRETLKNAIGFSVLWCLFISCVLVALARPMANIFSNDPIVVYYTAMAFAAMAPAYLFSSLISGWSSAFNAMGKPQISLVSTFFRMIVLMVPAVMMGAKLGGVFGVFMAIALTNIFCGIVIHMWARRIMGKNQAKLALETP
jgi:putative MATE family efflux protein